MHQDFDNMTAMEPRLLTEQEISSAPVSLRRELMSPVHRSVLPGTIHRVGIMRRMIHAPVLIQMLHTAALTGVVPQVDPQTGVEIGPARPIKPETQVDVALKLLAKALPDAKENAANYDDPNQQGKLIDVTPERVRTLTKEQLEAALAERFTTPAPSSPIPSHSTLPETPPKYFQVEDDGVYDE